MTHSQDWFFSLFLSRVGARRERREGEKTFSGADFPFFTPFSSAPPLERKEEEEEEEAVGGTGEKYFRKVL